MERSVWSKPPLFNPQSKPWIPWCEWAFVLNLTQLQPSIFYIPQMGIHNLSTWQNEHPHDTDMIRIALFQEWEKHLEPSHITVPWGSKKIAKEAPGKIQTQSGTQEDRHQHRRYYFQIRVLFYWVKKRFFVQILLIKLFIYLVNNSPIYSL